MRRVRVTVSGRVQGVGFRWHTRAKATRLDLAGWVRNRDDGSVEAEIEGEEGAVASLLRWLEHGPATAAVTVLDVVEVAATGESGFRQR